jgi:hypothetical protein
MVARKLLGLALFVVGLLWASGMAWVHVVMTGITEPVLPLPLHLFLGFIGPALLIVGSLLVIAAWHIRTGIALCVGACVLLTWWIGPDSIGSVIDLFRPLPPLQAPMTALNYFVAFGLVAFIITADVLAGILLWSIIKPSNKSLEPTAGRSDADV